MQTAVLLTIVAAIQEELPFAHVLFWSNQERGDAMALT